jgi:hypothetical protein
MADVDMLESDYEDLCSEDDESNFGSDVEELENKVPANKKQKAISSAKGSVLSINNNAENVSSKPKAGKTVEQMYQKKTQLEHILLRPDTYSKKTSKHTYLLCF